MEEKDSQNNSGNFFKEVLDMYSVDESTVTSSTEVSTYRDYGFTANFLIGSIVVTVIAFLVFTGIVIAIRAESRIDEYRTKINCLEERISDLRLSLLNRKSKS